MLILLLLIISSVLFLTFTEDYLGKYKWGIYILVCLFLIIYAGLKPIGFDRDSSNYQWMFMHPDSNKADTAVEPLFVILSRVLYLIWPDVSCLFLFFALLGITAKFIAIKQLTPMLFLPLFSYLQNFYLLHDLTQIRAGVTSGLFLLALYPLANQKKLKAFGIIILGVLFHYSALCLLPILFLNNKRFDLKWKIVLWSIVPFCCLLYIRNLDLLTVVEIPYITEKVETYKTLSEFGVAEKARLLSPFPVIKALVFLYLLYFAETIEEYIPSIYLLLRIFGCSLLAYFALSSFTILSMRISELYGIVEIILYPCIIYTVRPQLVGKCAVCIIAVFEMVYNLAINDLLDFTA